MGNRSMCAECGSDLVAVTNNHPESGYVAAIQFVQRITGKQVFICWHCADERSKDRQMNWYMPWNGR